MAYATKAGLQQRFGDEIDKLLDRNNDGTEDSGVFDIAAKDTDAVINGYVAALYALPFATVPDLIGEIAADICRYELWDDRAPEEVRKRYDDAIAKLRDIAKGLIVLPVDGVPVPSLGGAMSFTQRTRTFDDCTLGSFVGPTPSGARWRDF